MKTTQERFINLGGRFEVGIHYTHLIYNNYKMKIPNEYFLSTDVAHQEVLNYYLDMMPKIEGQSGMILPKEFGFEYIDPLTYCGTFDTKDCVSCTDLCKLLKVNEGEKA